MGYTPWGHTESGTTRTTEYGRRLTTLSAQLTTLFPRLYSGVTMSTAQAVLRFK